MAKYDPSDRRAVTDGEVAGGGGREVKRSRESLGGGAKSNLEIYGS